MGELRLPTLVLGHKIAQAFPAQPGFYAVKHTATHSESGERILYTHPPYRVSGSEGLNFPLIIVRYTNHGLIKRTYAPPSIRKSCSGSTTKFSRELMEIQEGLAVEILNLVDPWLQFSIFEDG